MLVDKEKIEKIEKLLQESKHDALKEFMSHPYADELECIKQTNLCNLFKLCEEFDIRYIYVHQSELCGCEDKRNRRDARYITDHGWPAMWTIARDLGLEGGCGNSDQYQIERGNWFPADAYGGWDLKEKRKLTDEEVKEKKFCRVVSREREKDSRW